MMIERYIRKQGIKEQKVGGEIVLIDELADRVHVLNATSAFVWTCLGEMAEAAPIEANVRAQFDSAGKDVGALVQRALDQLLDQGLITRSVAS
ncbi:MAG: PqqD family protein [bacterium]